MMPARKLPWKTICLLSVLGIGTLFFARRALHQSTLNAFLIAAVKRGDVVATEGLLHQGADANAAQPWFRSIPPSMEQWYWFRANISDKGNAPEPVLCLAVEKHNLTMVDLLLAHGANVNGRSCHNCTALFYASGDAPLIKELLQQGANPNAQNVFGEPALPTVTPPPARSIALKMGTNK